MLHFISASCMDRHKNVFLARQQSKKLQISSGLKDGSAYIITANTLMNGSKDSPEPYLFEIIKHLYQGNKRNLMPQNILLHKSSVTTGS